MIKKIGIGIVILVLLSGMGYIFMDHFLVNTEYTQSL